MLLASPSLILKIFAALALVGSAIGGARADAMVSGSVFCDQCKDGQLSLFDYPLQGMKVKMICPGGDGQMTTWKEEATNWFGNYYIGIKGTPDLTSCYVQVSGSNLGSNECAAIAGPQKPPKLMFRLFDMETYIVDPLLSQPAEPMSFCPRSTSPTPRPPALGNPVKAPPTLRTPPVHQAPPMLGFPPMPRLPPMPLLPFSEPSACPHGRWVMPEYRCYWRAVNPETKVAVIFGILAAKRYGTDLTLIESLQGRGEAYRTLLRESTTAFLNSYNSLQFPYNTFAVIEDMNLALSGSQRLVLHTALRFMRANNGFGNIPCKFATCK